MNPNKPQAMKAEAGMIFLENHHPVIVEQLTELLGPEAKREPVDVKICDFDDVEYHITVVPEEKDVVTFSTRLRNAKELMPMGSKAALDSIFGSALQDRPEQHYDITLKWNVDKVQADYKKIVQAASEIKRIMIGAPLERCFDALVKGQSANLKPMTIAYRAKENMWFVPLADRVLVFFSIDFLDDTDRALAKNLLQEFPSEQRKIQNAPAVLFSESMPPQLKDAVPSAKENPSLVGYVYFTIFKMHVDKPEKIKNAVNLFTNFRNYIQYHIKASKTYLQSRMRMRSELMLKVLNRANPEAAEAEKGVGRRNTTTTGGKTFRVFKN